MNKKLVFCPNCKLESKKNVSKWKGKGFNVEIVRPKPFVVGEIDDNRNFKIKRGGENYTIIAGSHFEVVCGNCGEPVYRKEVNNDKNGSVGLQRIYRQTLSGMFASFGTQGSIT